MLLNGPKIHWMVLDINTFLIFYYKVMESNLKIIIGIKIIIMKALWQVPVISIITICIALGYNQVRINKIPLFCPWSENISGNSLSEYASIISVDEAAALFSSKKAAFIDARPESKYNEGHIQGAISLPWHQAEEKFVDVLGNIPPEKTIITYCDGVTCDLCDKLAGFLCDLGFEQVRALVNGWTVWNQSNLPVDLPETSQ
jgi:rhodanese-related sulfurtransferase